MNLSYDIVIAGAGLAGACAALHLSRSHRVLLLEAATPAAGASGVAIGLVNPLMSKYGRPAWRMEEALTALGETLALAEAPALFHTGGTLRPAYDPAEAAAFQESARAYPHHASWLTSTEIEAAYPRVQAELGGLYVRSGGTVSPADLVRALLSAAVRQGAHVESGYAVRGWEESDAHAWVDVEHHNRRERIRARFLLLAVGAAWVNFQELATLRLHNIKGQAVTVRTPEHLIGGTIPNLAGQGYVVPDDHTLTAGSSYEHEFNTLAPTSTQTRAILERADRMLPGIKDAPIMAETAGVRVTVPGTRLPMIGPLPDRSRVWVFTGLGSKGLLMAPLLARELPGFLARPDSIPPSVQVKRRKRK